MSELEPEPYFQIRLRGAAPKSNGSETLVKDQMLSCHTEEKENNSKKISKRKYSIIYLERMGNFSAMEQT